MDNPSPISVGRVTAAVVAVALAGLTVYFTMEYRRRAAEFEQALTERSRFEVDFSQAGTIEAPFTAVFRIAHADAIFLRVQDASEFDLELLAPLRGTIEIVDRNGKNVERQDFWDVHLLTRGQDIVLARFWPFDAGDYVLRVHVTEPAPALAGRSQTIFAQYELCGLEKLPAIFNRFFAFISGALALAVGSITIVSVCRHGWRRGGKSALH